MLKRLGLMLTVLSLAGLMVSACGKWLTGGGSDKEPDQEEEEAAESISVGMQDSTYRVLESDLNHPGNQ